MNKICLNQNNEIIGFNMNNCFNFINIENVDDIYKIVNETHNVEKLDEFGRTIFTKQHKALNKKMNIALMAEDDSFDDNDFLYTKQYEQKVTQRKSYLINESNNFTFEDLVDEKVKQLKNKFGADECILFETFNNDIFVNDCNNNCIIGNTFMKINSESDLNITIDLEKHSQIMIYCESDNDVVFKIKNNIMLQNEYVKHTTKKLNLNITTENVSNIYSIAILIK